MATSCQFVDVQYVSNTQTRRPDWDCQFGLPPQTDPPGTTTPIDLQSYGSPMGRVWDMLQLTVLLLLLGEEWPSADRPLRTDHGRGRAGHH